MTLSAVGLRLLKSFEQCRLAAYRPTPSDVRTIGWGATRNADGSPIKPGDYWSQVKCDLRLDSDLKALIREVVRLVQHAVTTQPQLDALIVLAYNMGAGALAGSTLLRDHLAGNVDDAAEAFAEWRTQQGRVLPGRGRRLVGALAEQSTYTGLQGAALFIGLSESRYTAVAGLLVFIFGLAKIMLPDAGSAR